MEKNKLQVQQRYDEHASGEITGKGLFEVATPAKSYFRARKLSVALELGRFCRGSRLLEIGCSVGQYTFPLIQQGYRVEGVDLSPQSVAVARQRVLQRGLPEAQFHVGDAENLDRFGADSFDGAVSFSTLRYLSDLPKGLLEIRRVLKPGGRVIADFPNRWCPWFYVKQWLGSDAHPNDHWFSKPELRRLFERAGFRHIEIRNILFTPTVAPERLLPFFRRVDSIGERLFPLRPFAGILMIAANKP